MFQWLRDWRCRRFGCHFDPLLVIFFKVEYENGLSERLDSRLTCICCGKIWRKDDFVPTEPASGDTGESDEKA